MKTKFTPGPWQATNRAQMLMIHTLKGTTLADVEGRGKVAEANAALIAAAPEMFEFIETLKGLLSCKDDRGLTLENHIARCCETSEDAQSILDRFDYLISKARGES